MRQGRNFGGVAREAYIIPNDWLQITGRVDLREHNAKVGTGHHLPFPRTKRVVSGQHGQTDPEADRPPCVPIVNHCPDIGISDALQIVAIGIA
jgi:hypothetical protein